MAKGQGLSLNTIVIAVIVVVVMVILIGLVTGTLQKFVQDIFGESERMCTGDTFDKPTEVAGCSEGYEQVLGKFKEGEVPDGRICCQLVDS